MLTYNCVVLNACLLVIYDVLNNAYLKNFVSIPKRFVQNDDIPRPNVFCSGGIDLKITKKITQFKK